MEHPFLVEGASLLLSGLLPRWACLSCGVEAIVRGTPEVMVSMMLDVCPVVVYISVVVCECLCVSVCVSMCVSVCMCECV